MKKTRIFDLHADTLDRLAWPTLPPDLSGGSIAFGPGDETVVSRGALTDFLDARSHLTLRGMRHFSWCQCLAVFIPDTLTVEQSARFFDIVAPTLASHAAAHPDRLAAARTAAEIGPILESDRTAAILTIENGKLLAASPAMVDHIEHAGVRMVTLTWNAENPLGSGNETAHGLTSLGFETVAALEARHIVCDVSHLNDEGFWDLYHHARRPFAASHSNSRAICNHPRNLTDDQFRAIADAGGICGLNFCREFVSDAHPDPTESDLLAHLEHWLDLGGERVVCLGSDYDGCDVPSWLAPCERMEGLARLLERHFGQELAQRILFENAHDFFLANERP